MNNNKLRINKMKTGINFQMINKINHLTMMNKSMERMSRRSLMIKIVLMGHLIRINADVNPEF